MRDLAPRFVAKSKSAGGAFEPANRNRRFFMFFSAPGGKQKQEMNTKQNAQNIT